VVAGTLTAISDHESLVLFNTVALTPVNTEILISKSRLIRKQNYSRMSSCARAGLISKRNGKYYLTSFGKVVYDWLVGLDKIIGNSEQWT
jgi:hypothetical protein